MRVFISYAHSPEDQDFVRRLKQKITSWGYIAWLDDYILEGENFNKRIHEKLNDSDIVIGILSLQSLKSDYVDGEWTLTLKNNKPLILLKQYGVEDKDIPAPYTNRKYIDFAISEAEGFSRLKNTLPSFTENSVSTSSPTPLQPNSLLIKARTIFLGDKKAQHSQLLIHQSIFTLLGILDANDEEKEMFLDQLQATILDDFTENDADLLLTEDEFTEFETILENIDFSEGEKQGYMIGFLEKIIPDFEKIIFEKAFSLKESLFQERIREYLNFYEEDSDKVEQLVKARSLANEHHWKDAWTVINSLSA